MILALLGDPVEHSRSPAMQQAALDALGIEGRYEARRVDLEGLAGAVGAIRRGALSGANVTMPYKREAARLVDGLSEQAARAGAVNTLVAVDGGVMGYLTDVGGIREAWVEAGLDEHLPVLVLGAGGAAAAAVLAVEGRPLRVAARRPEAAAAMLASLGVAGEGVGWGEPWAGAVVVNATPLGMNGESLPTGLVEAGSGLFDMAYGNSPTPAVKEGLGRGLPVADGLDLLVAQGALSFSLWTGREAPRRVMAAAARTA